MILSGKKTFELRKNDRNFDVGDRLDLMEYDLEKGYTGKHLHRWITHILKENSFLDLKDYVILSFTKEEPKT